MIPSCDQTGVPGFVALTDAMVREVMVDRRRMAKGVRFIDKSTGKDCEARARVVVLAAGACESVRILLKVSPRQPPNSLTLASIKRDGDSAFCDVSFFFIMSSMRAVG